MRIMKSGLKNNEGKFFSQPGFEPWNQKPVCYQWAKLTIQNSSTKMFLGVQYSESHCNVYVFGEM